MRLRPWLLGIMVLLLIGCLRVAQRSAIVSKGYAVGYRVHRLHAERSNMSWLGDRVATLESPWYLSSVADERNLRLTAWSTLDPETAAGPGQLRVATARGRD